MKQILTENEYTIADRESVHPSPNIESGDGFDTESEHLRMALHYASLGIRVFPIVKGGRKPAIKGWKSLATTDDDQLRNWFDNPFRAYDIGAIPMSSGFVVLDVDRPELLDVLEDQLGEQLPSTLTMMTRRGFHLWFRAAGNVETVGNKFVCCGEIRGSSGFVRVPPSQDCYWDTESEMFDESYVSDVSDALIASLLSLPSPSHTLPNILCHSMNNNKYVHGVTLDDDKPTSVHGATTERRTREVDWGEKEDAPKHIQEALNRYLPSRQGQRNYMLLRFLREIKRIPEPPTEFPTELIKQWHKLAEERGSLTDEEDTLREAMAIWSSWDESKSKIIDAANSAKGKKVSNLEAPDGCHELAFILDELANDQRIAFISQRHLAGLLNVNVKTVRRWIQRLQDAEIVRIEKPYEIRRKATEYWIAELNEQKP